MLYSVTVTDDAELEVLEAPERRGDDGQLTDDETTQVHLRHMAGGAANVPDERIYKVEIPERPARSTCPSAMSPRFTITMT